MATVPIRDILDNETGEPVFPRTHAKAVIGLADSNFFEEYVDGNGIRSVKLRSDYAGLWTEGWMANGGIGNGGGGGGGGLINGVYRASDLGTIYSQGGTDDITKTFSAFAVDKIWQTVQGMSLSIGAQSATLTVNGTTGQFYTAAQVDNLLVGVRGFEPIPVDALPTASADTMYKLYLVPSTNPQAGNVKDEYITIRSGSVGNYSYSWELIGSTAIDLSGYVTTTALSTWAGSQNITTLGTISSGSIPLSLVSGASDLKAIEDLSGTSGFLKKTAANTWALDTTAYLPLTGGTMTGDIVMSGADIIPSEDLGSQLGYSNRRFSDINVRTVGSVKEIIFKHQTTGNNDGLIAGADGYFRFRTGANINTSFKEIIFHENYGLYPEVGSSVNLGYYSSTDNRFRWANIYAVNADLSGNLVLASTSHIDLGPIRLEYHSSTDSLHITTNDATNHPNIGFWVDGFNAAGGYGSNGGGGGIITSVYGSSDLGSVYSTGGTEDFTKTFSAFAIDRVWQTLVSLQNSTPDVSLTNGSSYSTLWVNNTSVTFYTKSQVDSLLVGIHSFDYVTASSLPTAGVDTMYKIYLVPSADPQTLNVKDEYITVRSGSSGSYSYSWEQIGSTAVDLSGYVTTTALGNWTGSTNITTLGTITTGTWSGTAIGVTKGGTGLTAISKGAILYASAANTISALSANGTSTKKFLSQTSTNAPSWGTISLTDISGTSDLQAIEDLSGTSGLLKKTAANTWTLDTTSYLSSHQTIYKLTLNAGSFTAGEYTPNSEAKLFNIPTTLDHISDGTTRKLANYLPIAGGTLTGDLRLKDNRNYGMTLRFGDGDYCYLNEDDDDHLLIYGSRGISIVAGSGYGVVISDYIEIGNARLTYDSSANALHITRGDGGAGVVGLYIDGFLSSGGAAGQSNVPDELNYAGRLYIQHNSNDLCLTTGGKTIIGSYPGSSAIGSNKFYVAGSSIGSAWNTSSDARLKEDISVVGRDEAVETIMKLHPVSWTWNERSELKGKRSAGLIAQQVESVIPYMVTGDEYKGLNYTMLHAFEIGAIQSHEDRIRTLERQVKSLNEEIERLRAS